MEIEQVDFRCAHRVASHAQRHVLGARATFVGDPVRAWLTRILRIIAAARPTKLGPIRPVDPPLVDQPDVSLMNEGGRLQRVTRPLPTQVAGCQAT